jgi:hypothetical protein
MLLITGRLPSAEGARRSAASRTGQGVTRPAGIEETIARHRKNDHETIGQPRRPRLAGIRSRSAPSGSLKAFVARRESVARARVEKYHVDRAFEGGVQFGEMFPAGPQGSGHQPG